MICLKSAIFHFIFKRACGKLFGLWLVVCAPAKRSKNCKALFSGTNLTDKRTFGLTLTLTYLSYWASNWTLSCQIQWCILILLFLTQPDSFGTVGPCCFTDGQLLLVLFTNILRTQSHWAVCWPNKRGC